MRRLLLLSLAGLAAAGLALARPVDAHAEDTAAVAINTKDGSSIFRLAFSIQRVAGDVVDNQNAAVAYASCEACQTVAISIQVVFVTGDASIVMPENYAIAVNQQCVSCETLASAYQFVFGTGGPVHFTAEGNQALAQLRREFQALRQESENLTIEQIQARVDALVDRLFRVLREELVRRGDAPAEGGAAASGGGGAGSQTTPTGTAGGGDEQPTTATSTIPPPGETGTATTETTGTTETSPETTGTTETTETTP